MTNSIAEIEDASCIFVIGSNTTECHPLIARRIYRAKEKGARLIVADPRDIQLSRFADLAVRHRLGSDVALLNGMMHVIIRNGWQAKDYIETRTEGYEELEEVVAEYTPERVEAITGVDAAEIRKMAELYAANRPASLVYAMGITQHSTGRGQREILLQSGLALRQRGSAKRRGQSPERARTTCRGPATWAGSPMSFPDTSR